MQKLRYRWIKELPVLTGKWLSWCLNQSAYPESTHFTPRSLSIHLTRTPSTFLLSTSKLLCIFLSKVVQKLSFLFSKLHLCTCPFLSHLLRRFHTSNYAPFWYLFRIRSRIVVWDEHAFFFFCSVHRPLPSLFWGVCNLERLGFLSQEW